MIEKTVYIHFKDNKILEFVVSSYQFQNTFNNFIKTGTIREEHGDYYYINFDTVKYVEIIDVYRGDE
jgi:hypothetical protein